MLAEVVVESLADEVMAEAAASTATEVVAEATSTAAELTAEGTFAAAEVAVGASSMAAEVAAAYAANEVVADAASTTDEVAVAAASEVTAKAASTEAEAAAEALVARRSSLLAHVRATAIVRCFLFLPCAAAFVSSPTANSRRLAVGLGASTKDNEGAVRRDVSNATTTDRLRADFERAYTMPSEEDGRQRRQPAPRPDGADAIGPPPAYDWWRQWYPIHVVDTIDRTVPQKAYLLGMELVIWYSASDDQWQVFEDACPHRQGPLSEGRIERGDDAGDESGGGGASRLLCSYHGWQFDAQGACAALPYSKPGTSRARHEASDRARCRAFPTRVEHGLLFVFPQSGPDAGILAALTPLTGIRELEEADDAASEESASSAWRHKVPAGVRDFPCGWDVMAENTLDPAHFCAAHHGTLGDRYADPRHYAQRRVAAAAPRPPPDDVRDDVRRSDDADDSFAVAGDFGTLEFRPPCLVRYTPDNPAMPFGGDMTIATYCVPTRPGWVRPLATVVVRERPPFWWLRRNVTLAEAALELFMNERTPAWLGHVLSSVVLHQDAGLLYYQHRNFRRKGYRAPDAADRRAYRDLAYMPNEADAAVALFRRWLDRRADINFDPAYRDDPTEQVDIFDMWHHTSQCKYCADAYRRLERARRAAWAVFYGSVLAAPVLTTTAATPADGSAVGVGPWAPLLVGAAAAATALGLERFNALFRRYEVRHTDDALVDKLNFFD